MRLIDADEVKKAFIGNRYGTKAIEYVIDNAPTVKAVPVEFIKEQIAKTTFNCDENADRFMEYITKMFDIQEKDHEENN